MWREVENRKGKSQTTCHVGYKIPAEICVGPIFMCLFFGGNVERNDEEYPGYCAGILAILDSAGHFTSVCWKWKQWPVWSLYSNRSTFSGVG